MPSLRDRVKALINVFDERENYEKSQEYYKTWSDDDLEMAGEANPSHLGIMAERLRRKTEKKAKGEEKK